MVARAELSHALQTGFDSVSMGQLEFGPYKAFCVGSAVPWVAHRKFSGFQVYIREH